MQVFEFLKNGKFGLVPDPCGPTKNVIEQKDSGPATAHVGLMEKHKLGNI